MTDLEAFTQMLKKARVGHSIQTKFADQMGPDEELGDDEDTPPERFFTDAATRITMHGGSGMHAEAEFDAAGNLLGIGRMEHY